MTTTFGPCAPWEARFPCDVSCESPTATGRAVEVATQVVWALSGRQFGTCQVTLRPCRRECLPTPFAEELPFPGVGGGFGPALIGGLWFNIACGSCPGTCSCSTLSEVVLPAPVSSIVQVKVDGVILVTGAYRVDDDRLLVRTDGLLWPFCNDLTEADTEVGTWSVTALYGQAVPEAGKWAVGELACELLKAMSGADCRLPQNVAQLVRQGVTIRFPDASQLFEKGTTGLYMVDLFIAAVNPSRLRRRSKTYAVDGPRHRRVGTS